MCCRRLSNVFLLVSNNIRCVNWVEPFDSLIVVLNSTHYENRVWTNLLQGSWAQLTPQEACNSVILFFSFSFFIFFEKIAKNRASHKPTRAIRLAPCTIFSVLASGTSRRPTRPTSTTKWYGRVESILPGVKAEFPRFRPLNTTWLAHLWQVPCYMYNQQE